MASAVSDKPSSGGGYIDVFTYDTNWVTQTFYGEGGANVYTRRKYGANNWTDWEKLALDRTLNNRVGGYTGVGTTVTFNCTDAFKSQQYVSLLISKDDMYIIALHNVNYGGISLKTGAQLQASISGNSVTISGLPNNTRYYVINVNDAIISSITFS